jgi:hypothetical protein
MRTGRAARVRAGLGRAALASRSKPTSSVRAGWATLLPRAVGVSSVVTRPAKAASAIVPEELARPATQVAEAGLETQAAGEQRGERATQAAAEEHAAAARAPPTRQIARAMPTATWLLAS